jgi:hypothetical protein
VIFQRVTPVFSGERFNGLAICVMLDPGFLFFFLCGEEDSFHAEAVLAVDIRNVLLEVGRAERTHKRVKRVKRISPQPYDLLCLGRRLPSLAR